MASATDSALVERLRRRLEVGYWPRVHCLILVTIASAAAFLTSFVMMMLHVHWMAIRYGVAALAGYATFLLLLSSWVRWKWSRARLTPDGTDIDVLDVTNNMPINLPSMSGSPAHFGGGGGRSGGGGASGSWGTPAQTSVKVSGGKGGGGWSLDLDGDDLFWLVVALAAMFAGLIAIGYVIWIAPTLLAEAIVNGAVAGKVYHGLRKKDDDFWTSQIFKRTIASGVAVIVCAVIGGYAFNRIAPEARSIGGVWAHLHSRSAR